MTCQTVYLSSRGNVMIVKNRHWGRWMKDLFSSNSIPKTWLTFLVTCSFSILASQFFRSSSCSPSPVQCVVNHSWAQLLPKKKKKVLLQHLNQKNLEAWCEHPDTQTAMVEVRTGREVFSWRHENKIIVTISRFGIQLVDCLLVFLIHSFPGNIDALFIQTGETKMIFYFTVDKLFWKKF